MGFNAERIMLHNCGGEVWNGAEQFGVGCHVV
jgi:hypothetical protein